jgi:hypothetical protein
VPDELRGRVMGIYTLVFFGSADRLARTGNPADLVGAPATLVLNAAILLLFAVYIYWRKPQMRHISSSKPHGHLKPVWFLMLLVHSGLLCLNTAGMNMNRVAGSTLTVRSARRTRHLYP